ncbi:hypothetical protein AB1N83_006241 [Pleurotus pulmonarius]
MISLNSTFFEAAGAKDGNKFSDLLHHLPGTPWGEYSHHILGSFIASIDSAAVQVALRAQPIYRNSTLAVLQFQSLAEGLGDQTHGR